METAKFEEEGDRHSHEVVRLENRQVECLDADHWEEEQKNEVAWNPQAQLFKKILGFNH